MVINDKLIIKAYGEYQEFYKKNNNRWVFANSVLYNLCKEHPKNINADEVVAKIWLIGRAYAAAIERRRNAEETKGKDFYYEIVAPDITNNSTYIDNLIESLNMSDKTINENLENVLELHYFLMNLFKDKTGMEKRSLASKYLHFHCPDKFFIYDSRAKGAIQDLVQRPNKKDKEEYKNFEWFDKEYADFVCRLLELREFLIDHCNASPNITPRDIDSFMIWYAVNYTEPENDK